MRRYITFVCTVCITILSISAEISVITHYESNYRHGSTYYVLDGESVTLVCEYGLSVDQVYDLRWSISGTTTFLFAKAVVPGTEVQGGPWEDRDVIWIYTDTSHRVTIPEVNIFTDGVTYRCYVETQVGETGDNADLNLNNNIYGVPDSVSISLLETVIESVAHTIQCTVSSIFPGKEQTEFRVKVGSDYHSGGSETESLDSNSVTYTVTYTHTLSFTRDQQGQRVHCEVTWGKGPIQVVKESSTADLDVYYIPSSLSKPTVAPSWAVNENTVLTLTCEVDSYPEGRLGLYRQGVSTHLKQVIDTTVEYELTVDRDDNGAQFYCAADDNNMHAGWTFNLESEKLRIDVLYSPLTVSITANSIPDPEEGDTRELTCTADGNPEPWITLYRREGTDSVQVGPSVKNSLVQAITMEREINRLLFYCTATSSDTNLLSYSRESVRKYYTVRFSASNIKMIQPSSGPVLENITVTFICVTDEAEPTAEVMWNAGDKRATSTSHSTEQGRYSAQTRRSVLELRVDRTLHNKTVECYVSGRSEVRDTVTLDVLYPFDVELIAEPEAVISEGDSLTLICKATGGNPPEVTYTWLFSPRYNITTNFSTSTITYDAVNYTQSGLYRCEAKNAGGTGFDEKEVIIQFSPVDRYPTSSKVVQTSLSDFASINCTVIAYPKVIRSGITIWFKGSAIPSEIIAVNDVKDKVDETLIQLTFNPVTADHFGLYEVTVNNGVGQGTVIRMSLLEQGVPQAPESVTYHSVTAISVTLSWVAGRNGGSVQTFTVYYRKEGESKLIYNDRIEDKGLGEKIFFKVSNLEPATLYFFKVQAKNSIGESNVLPELPVETLARPILKGSLNATVYEEHIVLEWPQIQGNYTSASLRQCPNNMVCGTIHNTTEHSLLFFVLNMKYNSESYLMTIYQLEDNVLDKEFTVVDKRARERKKDPGLIAGVVIASIIAGFLAVGIVCYLMFRRRKSSKSTEEATKDPTNPLTYENVVTSTSPEVTAVYEMTKPVEPSPPAEYAELNQVSYDNVE